MSASSHTLAWPDRPGVHHQAHPLATSTQRKIAPPSSPYWRPPPLGQLVRLLPPRRLRERPWDRRLHSTVRVLRLPRPRRAPDRDLSARVPDVGGRGLRLLPAMGGPDAQPRADITASRLPRHGAVVRTAEARRAAADAGGHDRPGHAATVWAATRACLDVTTASENHLHMPDSPGEALANIEQFFGTKALYEQYRRIELPHGHGRLALYRALLGH
jgi:hypothetical protein